MITYLLDSKTLNLYHVKSVTIFAEKVIFCVFFGSHFRLWSYFCGTWIGHNNLLSMGMTDGPLYRGAAFNGIVDLSIMTCFLGSLGGWTLDISHTRGCVRLLHQRIGPNRVSERRNEGNPLLRVRQDQFSRFCFDFCKTSVVMSNWLSLYRRMAPYAHYLSKHMSILNLDRDAIVCAP